MKEQVDGRHGNDDTVVCAGLLEVAHDAVALRRGSVNRYQIVVVQVHSPGADFGEGGDNLGWREGGADRVPEGIASPVPQSP